MRGLRICGKPRPLEGPEVQISDRVHLNERDASPPQRWKGSNLAMAAEVVVVAARRSKTS